jgi:hypothetical protein
VIFLGEARFGSKVEFDCLPVRIHWFIFDRSFFENIKADPSRIQAIRVAFMLLNK